MAILREAKHEIDFVFICASYAFTVTVGIARPFPELDKSFGTTVCGVKSAKKKRRRAFISLQKQSHE